MNKVFSQLTGPVCNVPIGQEVTYKYEYPTGGVDYLTFDWAITAGSAQITYNNGDGTVKVKWATATGQITVYVTSWHDGGLDEYGYPILINDGQSSDAITTSTTPTTITNSIFPNSGTTGFYTDQIPETIRAASITDNDCKPDVSYQWFMSTSPSGPFNPISGAVSSELGFYAPLAATSYFQRKVTMTSSGAVFYSNIVQLTLIPGSAPVPPDPDCVDYLGQEITYTADLANASFFIIDWSITGGTGHIVSDDGMGTVKVKWSSLPAQLNAHITYYTDNGQTDEYGNHMYDISEGSSSFVAKANVTTLPNVIQTATGNTSFSYNQTPDALVESVSTSGQNVCSVPKYQWLSAYSPVGPFNAISGAESATYNFSSPLQQTIYFERAITAPDGATSYSNIIKVELVSANWENKNYLREHTVLVPGVTDWKAVDQLPIGQKLQTTTYLDDLGRPIEKVDRESATPGAGNTLWGDVVHFSSYDPYGRQTQQYLSYSTTNESGKFKSDPVTGQSQYYAATYNDTHSYSTPTYDNSPLNRVTNIKSPGNSWANGQGNSVTYDLNDAGDNIQIFSIGFNTGDKPVNKGVYPDKTLFKNIITDENGKQVIQFTNKNGQVICKKVQLDDNPSGPYNGWICTYNVYDDFGRLRCEVQPEAVKWLEPRGWSFAATGGDQVLSDLCFRYEYDEKGRMVFKKAPGAKELYMLYDRRNRVVFTQDGNQHAKTPAEWMTTFYDELDRVTVTGLYKTTKTSASLQTDINNSVTTTTVTIPYATPNNFMVISGRSSSIEAYQAGYSIEFVPPFESRDGDEFIAEIVPEMLQGTTASITVFNNPVSTVDINDPSKFTALRYNYFDNYNYAGVKSFDNNFNNALAYSGDVTIDPIAKTSRTVSMITGTKVLVLGTSNYLLSTFYYDEKGRVIQTLGENIKLGTDITTSQYHFDGRMLSCESRHSASGTSYNNYSILTKNLFDRIGRLTSIQKKFGTNNFKTMVSYDLDDMNRLKAKHLDPGYTGTGKVELESLNYSYNIQGKITGINKDYALKTQGQYDKWGNFFGLYLGYDNTDGVFASAQLDGHISGALWTTQGDDAQRKYDYTYDNAGRLINALYNEKKQTTDAWSHGTMDFSVTGSNGHVEYDMNGNLVSMLQKGVVPGNTTPVTVDDLRYTYENNNLSNTLKKVIDNGALGNDNGKLGDFSDGNNGSNNDYVYDDNGNLITDLNKGITALNGATGIRYNYLDKPEELHINGKGTIKIVYDADGTKLQKIFTPDGSSISITTSYINEFVYRGDDLQYINFEEGRIRVMQTVTQNNGYDFLNIDGNIDLPGSKRGTYDFFIRDYLGNVRMILTEETHTGGNTCSMELNRSANEEPVFGQIDANGNPTANNEVKARFPVSNIPGQASGNGWQNSAIGSYVSRIGNLAGSKVGPNALLKVMAGDEVAATSPYYYQNSVVNHTGGTSFVSDLLVSLAQVISGSPITSNVAKTAASNITSQLGTSVPFGSFADPDASNATGNNPKAYLAVLYFDERFNFVGEGSITKRVTQQGNGAVPLNTGITRAPKNGYALVYVCNESDEMVYFDNLQVSHNRGRIIEEDHYYAYGLKIAGISSRKLPDANEGTLQNNQQYQGEHSEFDEDVAWNDFELRNYDPQIGRWIQIDPYDQFASGYAGMGNDPVSLTDPTGGIVPSGTLVLNLLMHAFERAAVGVGNTIYRNQIKPDDPTPNPLDLNSLKNNPDFEPLSTFDLRNMVKAYRPELESWEVNISAGIMLEDAYQTFSGFPRGSYSTQLVSGKPYIRIIRPDFKHPTIITDNKKTKLFPNGGLVEVKAIQSAITLKTSAYQIEAEIDAASYAGSVDWDGSAGRYNAGALTIVAPYLNSTITDDIKTYATRKGVNLYASYAFRNIRTGKIVFSVPERLNNLRRFTELPYVAPGSIDGVPLDVKKAADRWRVNDEMSGDNQ